MIDYKHSNSYFKIIDKNTNEIIAEGKIVCIKELPELLISFDFKHFFVTKENPLFEIIPSDEKTVIGFNNKYQDKACQYTKYRDNPNELIYLEHDINELDPEIAPLVYILNDAGYKTTGSCSGHEKIPAWIHILFDNMIQLQFLLSILSKEKFKYSFTLGTSTDIMNTNVNTIVLALQTTKIGKEAFEDILELTRYIEKQLPHLVR